MRVSLFVTCLTDTFAPDVGLSVVRVLEHFGCRIDFPADQTCCGQPQFNNGFHDHARTLARRMIEAFEGSPAVVTPSASCCAMVRRHYPALFADDPAMRRRAEAFAARTFEFVEFLTEVLRVDVSRLRLTPPRSVTVHYNCHQRDIHRPPTATESLLARLPGCTVIELPKSEQCCGFGGTFATKYPPISGSLVHDKVCCAAQTGASTLVVNDAGCSMNIAGAAHRQQAGFAIRHIAQLLAEALPPLPPIASEGKP